MGLYIFDTNALLRQLTLGFASDALTTPSVVEELRDRTAKARLSAYIVSGKLKVVKPLKRTISMVIVEAKNIGEEAKLSQADIEVAALALQLKDKNPAVLTDDYSLQNLLSKLDINFRKIGLLGIRHVTQYIFICTSCKRVYKSYHRTCRACGALLVRKAFKKRRLNRRL